MTRSKRDRVFYECFMQLNMFAVPRYKNFVRSHSSYGERIISFKKSKISFGERKISFERAKLSIEEQMISFERAKIAFRAAYNLFRESRDSLRGANNKLPWELFKPNNGSKINRLRETKACINETALRGSECNDIIKLTIKMLL